MVYRREYPTKGKGNPKTTNPSQRVNRSGKEDARSPKTDKENPKKASPAPKPKARPSAPAAAKKPSSPAPKPTARPSTAAPAKPSFSGNWVGAAPTEMQKRGGARISRGGGLLGKLRKK